MRQGEGTRRETSKAAGRAGERLSAEARSGQGGRRDPIQGGEAGAPTTGRVESRRRGPKPQGPRIRSNPRRGGRYDLVGFGGAPIPTGTHDEREALRQLGLELARRARPELVVSDPHVSLRTVIGESGGGERSSTLDHLLAFWGPCPLSGLTRDLCWGYVDRRMGQSSPNNRGGKAPAPGTIHQELATLNRVVKAYCRAHAIADPPVVYLPAKTYKKRGFLTVAEVKRLLRVASGLVWDGGAGAWRRSKDGRLAHQSAARVERWWCLRRLIPVLIWSASRLDVALKATWQRTPGHSWLDLRTGVLFRSADGEGETKKRRPPVKLPPKLLRLARRWARDDARRGIALVVHDGMGRPLDRVTCWKHFKAVCKAAGLRDGLDLQTLRGSSSVWLQENGCTPEETAEYLGNTEGVLSRSYDHFVPRFSHAAVDALDSRAY